MGSPSTFSPKAGYYRCGGGCIGLLTVHCFLDGNFMNQVPKICYNWGYKKSTFYKYFYNYVNFHLTFAKVYFCLDLVKSRIFWFFIAIAGFAKECYDDILIWNKAIHKCYDLDVQKCILVFNSFFHFFTLFEILIWTSNYFYEEVIVKMEINFQFFHHCSFSMRIWLGNTEELLNTSEVDCTPFFLLKEVALIFGSSFFLHIFYITE